MKIRFLIPAIVATCCAFGAQSASAAIDLQITAPANGSTVTETPFNMTLTADGNDLNINSILGGQMTADCWADGVRMDVLLEVCGSGNFYSQLGTNGAHTFLIEVTEFPSGDVNTATSTFTVADNAPPSLAIQEPLPNAVITKTPFALAYATDAIAGIYYPFTRECRVDDQAWESCSQFNSLGLGWLTKYFPPSIANGPRTLSVRITDPAGNQAENSVNVVVNDTDAPTVDFIYPTPAEASVVTSSPPWVVFEVDGNPYSGTLKPIYAPECQLDSGPWESCKTGWYAPRAGNGVHTVRVRATDAVGNQTNPGAPRSFTVDDHVAPDLILNRPLEGESMTDPWIGVLLPVGMNIDVFYRVDGGMWQAGTMMGFDIPMTTNGAHTLDVKMVDWAGNESPVEHRNVVVNSPLLTAPKPGPPPTASVIDKSLLASVSARRKLSKKWLTITAHATLNGDAGAPLKSCDGAAKAEIWRGKKILKSVPAKVKSVKGSCILTATVKIAKKKAGGKLKIKLYFSGNATTAPSVTAKSLK